jgi:hypothetical protein
MRMNWWIWWSNQNPEWRPRLNERIIPGGTGSWSGMHLPGRDGFVYFILALRWWYMMAEGDDHEHHWQEALRSVYWTMGMLIDDLRYVFNSIFLIYLLIIAIKDAPAKWYPVYYKSRAHPARAVYKAPQNDLLGPCSISYRTFQRVFNLSS